MVQKLGHPTEAMGSVNADMVGIETTMAGLTTEMTNVGLDLSRLRNQSPLIDSSYIEKNAETLSSHREESSPANLILENN